MTFKIVNADRRISKICRTCAWDYIRPTLQSHYDDDDDDIARKKLSQAINHCSATSADGPLALCACVCVASLGSVRCVVVTSRAPACSTWHGRSIRCFMTCDHCIKLRYTQLPLSTNQSRWLRRRTQPSLKLFQISYFQRRPVWLDKDFTTFSGISTLFFFSLQNTHICSNRKSGFMKSGEQFLHSRHTGDANQGCHTCSSVAVEKFCVIA